MPLYTIKKNNVTVHGNSASDRTMVFAHGFGTDQTAWEQVVESFKKDFRIVLYDNVGAGKSDPAAFSPNKYDNLDAYAADLINLCDALGVRDAIVVAHSVSAMVSSLAAIKRPELFSKLILVGASPRYLDDGEYHGGFDRPSLDGLFGAMDNNYFAWVSGFAPAAMRNADRPQLAEGFAASLSAIRPDIAQSVARVIFQSDYRHILSQIDKPTLLLQTKTDIAVPGAVAEYLQSHIRNSKLEVVNAEGHFPHISAAGEIIKAIEDFI
jgi:sigma-B regulation protein RsbQ